jgi:murein DD-endopeptidase MepM/ murein hydrolase activator NlpD
VLERGPPASQVASSFGHRSIGIGAAMGSVVAAAQDGVVAFPGPVAGNLYVSIDHADGVRT